MADGDRQLAFTTGPLPVSVQVSGADKLTPKTVNASFDGTGAAGPFLPCLIITGRTGHEVARIPAPQVAAGASAEVSWFPRVAAAVASGSSALSWCTAASAAAQTVVAGASGGRYGNLVTNDPAAFSIDHFGRIVFGATGTYAVLGEIYATNPQGGPVANPWTTVLQGGPGAFPAPQVIGLNPASGVSGNAQQFWGGTWIFVMQVGPGDVGGTMNWNWNNLTGVDLDHVEAGVLVVRIAD